MKCRSHMSWSKAAVAALPSGVCKPSLRGFSLTPLCFGTCPLLSHLLEVHLSITPVERYRKSTWLGLCVTACRSGARLSATLGVRVRHTPPSALPSICLSLCPPPPHHTRPVHRVTNGSLPLLLPRLSVSSSSWCALWPSP